MSIPAMKWALDLRGIKPNLKLVLLILADHADKFGGSCFPGIDTIAAETGLSRRAVIDNLKRLEDCGLLGVERRPGEGAGRRSNSYTLPIGQGAESAHRGKVQILHGQSADSAGQSAGAAPEPSDNHQIEPPVKGWGDCPDGVDRTAWAEWSAYKAGKPAKQTLTKVANFLSNYPPDAQRQIVDASIRNQWAGLFPPKEQTHAATWQRRSRFDLAQERLTGAGPRGPSEARLVGSG